MDHFDQYKTTVWCKNEKKKKKGEKKKKKKATRVQKINSLTTQEY